MASDHQGNVFFTGQVFQFPVTPGAAQVQPGGGMCQIYVQLLPIPCTDAYVAKINAETGAIVFATYLGGDLNDAGTGIAVGNDGSIYVTGYTLGDFPKTPGAFDSGAGPGLFVARLSADGTKFLYSAGLRGRGFSPGVFRITAAFEPAPAIAVDSDGNAYITGPADPAGSFVAKLSPDGSTIRYYKTLHGESSDMGTAISVAGGYAYVTGLTWSPAFPVTSGAFQPHLAGPQNAFLAKLDSAGNIVFATYLGGSGYDQGTAIQVDAAGEAYVGGTSTSMNFPTTAGSYLPAIVMPPSSWEPGGFAAKLSARGDALLYSTYIIAPYFAGSAVTGLVLDPSGNAFVAGQTAAGYSVTASAPQPCLEGGSGAVVLHLDQNGALLDRTYAGIGPVLGLAFAGDRSVTVAVTSIQNPPAPALAQLTFGDSQSAPASCVAPQVLNAASFFDGIGVVPGSVITLTGFGMGPQDGLSSQPGPDGKAPLQLGGVQLFFDDQAAPLLYVQSQQINALAPFELAGTSSTNVRVVYNGSPIGSFSEPVTTGVTGLFRSFTSTQAAARNQDGTVNGPSHPAPAGSYVSLYGTGFGQTQLPGVTGQLFPDVASWLVNPVQVTIARLPAHVQYAGAAPLEYSGVTQINVQVPAGAGSGPVSVSVTSAIEGVEVTTIFVK